MYTYPQFTYRVSNVAAWLAEHPAAVRLALIALTSILALTGSLLTHNPVYACPSSDPGCGGSG